MLLFDWKMVVILSVANTYEFIACCLNPMSRKGGLHNREKWKHLIACDPAMSQDRAISAEAIFVDANPRPLKMFILNRQYCETGPEGFYTL